MRRRNSAVFLVLTVTLAAGISMTVKSRVVKSSSPNNPTGGPPVQENSQAANSRNAKASQYKLSVKLEKTQFTTRDLVLLHISLRNKSRQVLPIVESSIVEDYKITVRSEDEGELQLSEWGKKLLEVGTELGKVVVEINPGQEINKSAELSKLYDLTPGTYTVTVKRFVLTQARTKFIELESNSVKLKIAPAGSGSEKERTPKRQNSRLGQPT